jgi:hypothetical protein
MIEVKLFAECTAGSVWLAEIQGAAIKAAM